MNDALQRDTLIDLLGKLGCERDEDALAAARALHSRISDSGARWQDLLVARMPVDDDVANNEDKEDDASSAGPVPKLDVNEAETRALIEKLLAREGNSDDFRQELEEYKSDLANGTFEPGDHRYVHALYARLTRNG